MKIKFCGITELQDAQYAVELGVDALGFIFYPKSPRNISFKRACDIAAVLPPYITRVAVTVNASFSELREIHKSGVFDCFQLHGDETPEQCRTLAPLRLVKACGVPLDKGMALKDYAVSAVLLDKASPKRGGTGEVIDWNVAAEICKSLETPVILSGGLNPQNVQKAVEIVQPYGIDICSGIECEPGKKDYQKMKELISKCRQ